MCRVQLLSIDNNHLPPGMRWRGVVAGRPRDEKKRGLVPCDEKAVFDARRQKVKIKAYGTQYGYLVAWCVVRSLIVGLGWVAIALYGSGDGATTDSLISTV